MTVTQWFKNKFFFSQRKEYLIWSFLIFRTFDYNPIIHRGNGWVFYFFIFFPFYTKEFVSVIEASSHLSHVL